MYESLESPCSLPSHIVFIRFHLSAQQADDELFKTICCCRFILELYLFLSAYTAESKVKRNGMILTGICMHGFRIHLTFLCLKRLYKTRFLSLQDAVEYINVVSKLKEEYRRPWIFAVSEELQMRCLLYYHTASY